MTVQYNFACIRSLLTSLSFISSIWKMAIPSMLWWNKLEAVKRYSFCLVQVYSKVVGLKKHVCEMNYGCTWFLTLPFLFLQPDPQIVLAKLCRWLHPFRLATPTTSAFEFFHCRFHTSLIVMNYVNIKLYTDILPAGSEFTQLLLHFSL